MWNINSIDVIEDDYIKHLYLKEARICLQTQDIERGDMGQMSGNKRGQGMAEIIVGFILILVFFATLTMESIPIVWTGAMLMGVVFILYGLYHLVKG